jgi:hypothetical protein
MSGVEGERIPPRNVLLGCPVMANMVRSENLKMKVSKVHALVEWSMRSDLIRIRDCEKRVVKSQGEEGTRQKRLNRRICTLA